MYFELFFLSTHYFEVYLCLAIEVETSTLCIDLRDPLNLYFDCSLW